MKNRVLKWVLLSLVFAMVWVGCFYPAQVEIEAENALARVSNTVAAPIISPSGGDFIGSHEVTLNCATSNVSILYTTDGSDPTVDSRHYSAIDKFSVTATRTVKAIAMKEISGIFVSSDVASAEFNKVTIIAVPIISPNGGDFVGSQVVTLTCSTLDTTIYYTVNGSDPTVASLLYSPISKFSINGTTTVKAIATKANFTSSAVASAEFTERERVATPVISPNGGDFIGSQEITVTCATPGAKIYFFFGDNEPTARSLRSSSTPIEKFTITETKTVNVIAVKDNFLDSNVASATFTKIEMTPVISPNGGDFFIGTSQEVTLTSPIPDPDATILYTLDGTNPTWLSSLVYSAAEKITITETTIVKARIVMMDGSFSAVASATFTKFKMETVLVEKGTFTMGSPVGTPNSEVHERPMHSVTLTRDFQMGKYEVTQSQWKAVMGSDIATYDYGVGDNFPVYYINWYDSIAFCNKLSEREGLELCYTGSGTTWTFDYSKNGYRLPTEAEREYAARGGKHNSPFPYSGSDTLGNVAWFYDNSGDNGTSTNGKTHAVGTKSPNALGLYDMSGNVFEWCWDWIGNYSNISQTDPTGASEASFRVLRGGSFCSPLNLCRVASRNSYFPDYCDMNYGFRVVRSCLPQ